MKGESCRWPLVSLCHFFLLWLLDWFWKKEDKDSALYYFWYHEYPWILAVSTERLFNWNRWTCLISSFPPYLIQPHYQAGGDQLTLVFAVSIHFLKSSFNTSTYQTLSSVQRTFVFLGSRCTQPLTLRIFKIADRPKREIKKTKRLCNEYSTYTLVRKANPRKKDTNCMILRSIWY